MVNMTSDEIFKTQVATIYGRLRHINSKATSTFQPTHLGGIFGQRSILEGDNVMRVISVRPEE